MNKDIPYGPPHNVVDTGDTWTVDPYRKQQVWRLHTGTEEPLSKCSLRTMSYTMEKYFEISVSRYSYYSPPLCRFQDEAM